MSHAQPAETVVQEIRRRTRRQFLRNVSHLIFKTY